MEPPAWLKRLTRYRQRHMMAHPKEIPTTERHVLKTYQDKFRDLLKVAPRTGGRVLEPLTGDHRRRMMAHRKEIPITERHV